MKGKEMVQTSEYCAVGHPDRLCDYIVAHILDRYIEKDPHARVALECQLKDEYATLSGEVTSKCAFTSVQLAGFVREAIRMAGYTSDYQRRFGEKNTISADDVSVTLHISQQSANIAQGVNREGWGDQGIFHGMAVNDPEHGFMPLDYRLARELAQRLYRSGIGGIDIKTQVTVVDGKTEEVVVAIPLANDADRALVEHEARILCGKDVNVIVNGTGSYVVHGPIGDCGTTGRKLVVDFYGGNSKIGGGSPWGKDPTKADVTLNILARLKALEYLHTHEIDEVHCAISCCIGRPEIRISWFDAQNRLLETCVSDEPPSHVIESLGLGYPGYAERCREGLFGHE